LAAAAGIPILLMLGVSTRRTRTSLLMVAAPVATFVILVNVLGNNGLTGSVTAERLGGGAGANQSDSVRRQTWQDSIAQAGDHLVVGSGFVVVRSAHNIYLQLLGAGGALALGAFLAYMISLMRRARRLALARNGSPPWLMALAAGSGASVCVWLLYGMVGNAIYDRYLYVPVGLVLALGLVHRRFFVIPEADPARPQSSPGSLGAGRRSPRRAYDRVATR